MKKDFLVKHFLLKANAHKVRKLYLLTFTRKEFFQLQFSFGIRFSIERCYTFMDPTEILCCYRDLDLRGVMEGSPSGDPVAVILDKETS